jgi:hypothetical protein
MKYQFIDHQWIGKETGETAHRERWNISCVSG